MSRRDAPATHRNREPIADVLRRWVNGPARVVEVASGTGQHAVYFAEVLPEVSWQPTDADPSALPSIEAWIQESGARNVAPPILLDASDWPWPVERVDVIFNANMIHISPWAAAEGLFAGAGRILAERGLLLLYGPFKQGGLHTSPSNAAFDEDLRRRDPRFGVRDLEEVEALGEKAGLALVECNTMPANNMLLVFRRLGEPC